MLLFGQKPLTESELEDITKLLRSLTTEELKVAELYLRYLKQHQAEGQKGVKNVPLTCC